MLRTSAPLTSALGIMEGRAIEAWLFAAIFFSLLAVLFGMLLRARIPKQHPSYHLLFRKGVVPMYTSTESLRFRYLLPWVHPPMIREFGVVARWSYRGVQISAAIAALAVLAMVALGAKCLN